MDKKTPSSFSEGESLHAGEPAADSKDDDRGPGKGRARADDPPQYPGEGAVETVSVAARISAGWRWASLPLAPLLVFMVAAVGFSVGEPEDWPPLP